MEISQHKLHILQLIYSNKIMKKNAIAYAKTKLEQWNIIKGKVLLPMCASYNCCQKGCSSIQKAYYTINKTLSLN
jgi:hypothetical protein